MGVGLGRLFVALLLAEVLFAGCMAATVLSVPPAPAQTLDGREDVVVVAVLDWQIDPYHWDYLAAHMPQHQDTDASNDLPLSQEPSTWLPGFPSPSSFASYTALNLSLTPDQADAVPAELYEKDKDEWAKVQRSTAGSIHLSYIPGTKVVGLVSTSDGPAFATNSHGVGASSVSVGNIYGTCPSCLLVFVNVPGAAGEQWVREQDWIDVTTHSYEGSTTPVFRDNVRNCDPQMEKQAVERGQQVFWAAGNGLNNDFLVPQSTLVNCKKAPDWNIAVGAVHPTSKASYTGHGKPVDVASVGSGYPRAGADTVTAKGTFSGTSNASPVAAGLYAQALHELRAATAGDKRIQRDGIILEGQWTCGTANPQCALADGRLTVHELREAYFRAASPTGVYFHHATAPVQTVGTPELDLWTKGHGVFLGRIGDAAGEAQAIVDHATGEATEVPSPELRQWMVAYSWCSQRVWGSWDHGYWKAGMPLPAPDSSYPQRSWMSSELCPLTVKGILQRA